jgi:hypothetical protein
VGILLSEPVTNRLVAYTGVRFAGGTQVMRIRSERDAIEFLTRCWHDPDFGNDNPLVFETCVLRVHLEPGDGTSDWRTAQAIRQLQRHVNLTYLLAKSGAPFGRLSAFDRERLRVAVTIEPGSTKLASEFAKAMTAIQQALPAHWPTRTRNIVAAGALIGFVALPYAEKYVTYRAEVDKAHILAAASIQVAEQTNRTNLEIAKIHVDAQKIAASNIASPTSPATPSVPVILATLVRHDVSNVTAFAVSNYVPWRPALMDLAPYAGTIRWNDSRPIPTPAAKALAKADRAEATAQRRIAKQKGQPVLIATPWVTEVLRTHQAPGAMRLGLSQA